MVLEACQQSLTERYRGALYHILRDELDYILIQYILIDSLHNFRAIDKEYPFVEKKELKPGARSAGYLDDQMKDHNNGLVLFINGILPDPSKEDIRFKRINKVTKENLGYDKSIDILFKDDKFEIPYTYFENPKFEYCIRKLVRTEYSLLVQQDLRVKKKERYSLTHYKVRIGLKISEMVKDLGIELGYINDENDKKWRDLEEQLEEKFFEYFGLKIGTGGRTTAAALAGQYLKRFDFPFTVYVGSSGLRTLIRISRKTLFKFCLLKLSKEEIMSIEENSENKINLREQFVIHEYPDKSGAVVFLVTYKRNIHSIPNDDKKGERVFLPGYNWLNVGNQLIIPKRELISVRPIEYKTIYK